jgi:uncharacterized protein (DUF983 family)
MDSGRRLTGRERRTCFARGWRGRCPQCGTGRVFAAYGRPRRECDACGLVFRREQGAMTGSMYLSAAVTEIAAAALILGIFFGTDWSVALSLAVSVPLVLAFCAWWLPRSIGLWVALEYLTDAGNGEPWVDPRF